MYGCSPEKNGGNTVRYGASGLSASEVGREKAKHHLSLCHYSMFVLDNLGANNLFPSEGH
jgi:hypothetical protein